AADRRRRQQVRPGGRAAARDPQDRRGARDEADRARAGGPRTPRFRRGRSGAHAVEGRRGARRPQPHGADRRRVAGVRDDGRDVRRAARGVGRLARNTGLLALAAVVVAAGCGSTESTPPHVKSKVQPAERRVALEFIHTAVARKNLARAWELAAPELRHDTTREEWLAGTMRVVPYPGGDKPGLLRPVSSFEDTARVDVAIGPEPFTPDLRKGDREWPRRPRAPGGAHPTHQPR